MDYAIEAGARVRGPRTTEPRARHPGLSKIAVSGFTLIEVLIAIAIAAIGLLALSATLLSDFSGVRRDGQTTVMNQVAVTVLEDLRLQIMEDSSAMRVFDAGLTNVPRAERVGGIDYSGTYSVVPRRIDSSGNIVPSGGAPPHAFEVTFTAAPPGGVSRTYTTLVVRNP
jgi:prepilin-type N-terminal cleavage/methylation domain-containing protein